MKKIFFTLSILICMAFILQSGYSQITGPVKQQSEAYVNSSNAP